MTTFVLIAFWFHLVALIVKVAHIGVTENWPVPQKPKGIGMAVAECFELMAWVIFAGIILWMK